MVEKKIVFEKNFKLKRGRFRNFRLVVDRFVNLKNVDVNVSFVVVVGFVGLVVEKEFGVVVVSFEKSESF